MPLKLIPSYLIALSSLLLSACSPVNMLNGLIPTQGYTIKRDIAYGEHARQQLDIYIPKAATNKRLPVVVFLYGGSWESGNKQDYLFAAEAFASQGYIVVIPDCIRRLSFPQ